MSKTPILSHELALQDALKFLSFSKGLVSKRPASQNEPIPPGLDIYVPYTKNNQVLLVGAGAMLNEDVNVILTLSIAGQNKARTDVLSGQQSVASSSNNIWWNFPLVVKKDAQAATEALEIASQQERPLPLVRLSDLIEANKDPLVERAIQGILSKTKDTEGPSYYNTASPLVHDPAAAFMVFAPSSAPDSVEGLWSNAPGNKNRQADTNTTGTSNGAVPGMDMIG